MNIITGRKNRSDYGFTIVELLIVIVVIGILAAIIIVAYTGVTNKANLASAKGNAEGVQKVAEAYNADNSSYPTTAQLNGSWTNQTARIPNGVTVDTTMVTSSDKAGNHIFYKEKGVTGGCLGYWDVSQNAVAWVYTGDATSYDTGTLTCG